MPKRLSFLVSAGPTREFLDPVRFLSNRSTGKMGFAIAEAAAERGHPVELVAGPVALPTPSGVRRTDVVSARDMLAALEALLPGADVLVMTAAVADWRPRETCAAKLKKREMAATLELAPNPDILATLAPRKGSRTFVGFAAETGDPLPEAARKLVAKGLDLIVANDVSRADSGFAVDTNRVTLLAPGRDPEAWPLLSKREVATRLVARLEALR
ncbi:MAG: phosphopantothenoylcysteine decarboxylase [Kiritimatiellia bacterium]|jgi:phosphopantothenoylcysteine decarboxylase/phosphopantothenate--cysteine ligase